MHGKSVYPLRAQSSPALGLDLTSYSLQSNRSAAGSNQPERQSHNSPQSISLPPPHSFPSLTLPKVYAAKADCGLSYRSELQLC